MLKTKSRAAQKLCAEHWRAHHIPIVELAFERQAMLPFLHSLNQVVLYSFSTIVPVDSGFGRISILDVTASKVVLSLLASFDILDSLDNCASTVGTASRHVRSSAMRVLPNNINNR
ncbi:unnamed protein product [Musa acuminata subsp. malaccensis]|uniref:(wild Malaysian banana) hypothetical protein n=1 Tax=Musa acuminata subsp. malaccensis TaxID=214687 RepID=A0A804KGL0_MUSAM|nr:unnamed protein product [Musa acuminata subsp. malaccensis]